MSRQVMDLFWPRGAWRLVDCPRRRDWEYNKGAVVGVVSLALWWGMP